MLYIAATHNYTPNQKLQEENGAWKKDPKQKIF